VIAQIKATGGKAFSTGRSAYRGVCWHKTNQKWLAQFRPGNGKQLVKSCTCELDAARQYDVWCKQYGRWVRPCC